MRHISLTPLLFLIACHSQIRYPPGGYDYPKQVTYKDTNYYYCPIRDKESRRDSFRDAWAFKTFRDFDEPNLSLEPMATDVFRLTYSEALDPTPYLIILKPGEIVVKTGKATDDFARYPDTNRLTPLERMQVLILDRNYPLNDKDTRRSEGRQRRLDSLGKVYPQLYDASFYYSLWEKEWTGAKPIWTYTTKTIKITPKVYDHLVSTINASGFWQLPVEMPCEDPPFDGYGFILEANTRSKYNIVRAGCCDNIRRSPFANACQQLVHYAGLEEKIFLIPSNRTDTAKTPLIIQDVQLEEVKEERRKPKQHRKQ
ncbi:MAG TPA: hypothetical protein VK518_23500 [Puia sp.]|nr:hypothetical protein [Puia sp.]